jgi:hypothetical protein
MFVSRQRDAKDNCLWIEVVAGGPSKAGPDILPARYAKLGEQKNFVNPQISIEAAEKIYKAWSLDYADENKRLRIVNAGPNPIVYNCDAKGFAAAKKWADKTLADMEKCGNCKKPMGNKDPYEYIDLGAMVFCTEVCAATKYRDMFNAEMPAILSNKTKKNAGKRKP